jgi:hypothetical protein
MKTKTLDRRLSLNKATIAHLNANEMGRVQGGGDAFYFAILEPIPINKTLECLSTSEGPGC